MQKKFPALRLAATAVVLVTAFSGIVVPTVEARAATTGGISGVISRADGRPDSRYMVYVDPVDPASSTQNGWHDVTNDGVFDVDLPPGAYWVKFAGFPGVADEWWGDVATRGASTKVVVDAGRLTHLDPQLSAGGSISGTIDPAALNPKPLSTTSTAEVFAADPTVPGGYVKINADAGDENGDYWVPRLHPGTYVVRYYTDETGLEGWWNDPGPSTSAARSATTVTVTEGDDTSGVDPVGLHPQGTVTGTVRRGDGKRLSGVAVTVLHLDDYGEWVTDYADQGAERTVTSALGTYRFQAPSGPHRLRYSGGPAGQPIRTEFSGGAATVERARDVVVQIDDDTRADTSVEPVSVVADVRAVQSGTPRVGATLTVSHGTWYPSTARLVYQWARDGVPISGEHSRTYRVRPSDLGARITARVRADKPGYTSAYTYIAPRADKVLPGRFEVESGPRVRGHLTVGSTLRVSRPVTHPFSSPRYQWQRDGKPIGGATSATYQLRPTDRGRRISVRVRAIRGAYETLTWHTSRLGPIRAR
ncbi:carboxypeptidase-like regulatory domain-containing protein [Nocardioides plantarum]|uniref:Carboxypeptidase-like regulatory domain-containing protein n=1 Tax=Nocardioides plantarum TaxID=29299 RepID=A0ABV5KHV8_9ACTN|nr:carboxypeptidase-like regulatory domain-containing protein [Nocardioides plantarum]